MRRVHSSRRGLLRSFAGVAVAGPLAAMLPREVRAQSGVGQRVIFFYFPDGVAGPSANGEPSLWHATGSEFAFSLPDQLTPLADWSDRCVFLNGLSSGPTDSGSHPGGAQKLLTAADHAANESIDQYLARTVGASSPWRHLYLGVQSTLDGASGDKHVSYPSAGVSIPPQDDARIAFGQLFGETAPVGAPTTGTTPPAVDPLDHSVLDTVMADLDALRAKLGGAETAKLDLHLDALRQLEQRLDGIYVPPPASDVACGAPTLDTSGVDLPSFSAPEAFPAQLEAQLDLVVLAMACGMTRVATVQGSHHTSELVMSRFAGTEMYDPGFDMRSHQASHYGPAHDPASREFTAYVQQRRWWVERFAGLLARLDGIPEGDGTMLDNTLCVLCSEVCDGNTHLHDNLPFVLAGAAGGALRTGRLLDVGYRRHGDLWVSVANALGDGLTRFGDASSGPVPGLLG